MEKITLGPMPYMSVMPTLLVGANVKGKPNYMTAAWATVACMSPPMVCVALNRERYTVQGIDENKTFSLNVPSVKQVVETDHCGLVSGAHTDKSMVFRSFYGKLKTAPLAEEHYSSSTKSLLNCTSPYAHTMSNLFCAHVVHSFLTLGLDSTKH